MKIFFTTSFYPPYHVGGDAVHVKYLSEALAEEGHEVHVLHSMDAYNLSRKEKRDSEKSKVIVHTLRSPLGKLEPLLNYSIGSRRHTIKSFKELIKEEKFDVVHHHNVSLLGYNILRKIGDYKNLYTAHDYWLICHKYDLIQNKNICENKKCFSCCVKNKKVYQFFRNSSKFKDCLMDIDTIITPSKFMANRLQEKFTNTKVINNFVPEHKTNNRNIEDYFVYAGVLLKCKGVMNLVKVFSQINKKLLIIGTGDLEKTLKKLKMKNIEVLGFKEQKEFFPLIASAQALIVPSVWLENNPLIALESLSLGTPVIGSNSGGIPEIVGKIDKKLIFNKDDLEQLKSIVLNFDRSKYPSKDMKSIYKKYYSKKRFLGEYNKLIKR